LWAGLGRGLSAGLGFVAFLLVDDRILYHHQSVYLICVTVAFELGELFGHVTKLMGFAELDKFG